MRFLHRLYSRPATVSKLAPRVSAPPVRVAGVVDECLQPDADVLAGQLAELLAERAHRGQPPWPSRDGRRAAMFGEEPPHEFAGVLV